MLLARPLAPPRVIAGTCSAGDVVGDCVRLVGGQAFTRADPSLPPATTSASGVIVSKPSATTCIVQGLGAVTGVFGALVPGVIYWVGLDGRPTATPPVPELAAPQVFLQEVGVAISESALELRLHAPKGVRVL